MGVKDPSKERQESGGTIKYVQINARRSDTSKVHGTTSHHPKREGSQHQHDLDTWNQLPCTKRVAVALIMIACTITRRNLQLVICICRMEKLMDESSHRNASNRIKKPVKKRRRKGWVVWLTCVHRDGMVARARTTRRGLMMFFTRPIAGLDYVPVLRT